MFELLAGLVMGHKHQEDVAWESDALWEHLIPLAELHRVTAGLSGRLRDLSLTDRIPPEALAFLDAVHELNLERNQALERQCLETLQVLQDEDIPALPLKGLAVQLMGLFADRPGQRMTVDIDILVPATQADAAQDILQSIGYQALTEHETSKHDYHNLPRLKSDPERHGPGSIEVHFRVGGDDVDAMLPADHLMAAAQSIDVEGQRVLVPSVCDLLDHAVMHSAMSHGYARRRTMRLRDALDISKLWSLAIAQGHGLKDLKIRRHDLALRYFGACVVLSEGSAEDLGALHPRAAGFLKQVLWRQSIPERALLESSLLANAQLITQEPSRFFGKLVKGRFYTSAKSAFKSPTV